MVNEFAELLRLKYLRGQVGLSALLGDRLEVKTFGVVLVPNFPRIEVVLVPDYPKDKSGAFTRLRRDSERWGGTSTQLFSITRSSWLRLQAGFGDCGRCYFS